MSEIESFERDELISAYVDGQLTALQHAAFEGRMRQEPALRRDVAATEWVRQTARQMAAQPLPRHFALPAHYAAPVKRGLAEWWNWQIVSRAASVVCGAMCLLLLSVDIGQRVQIGRPTILSAFNTHDATAVTLQAYSGATLMANGAPIAPLSIMTDLPNMAEVLPSIQATSPALAPRSVQTPVPPLPDVQTVTSTPALTQFPSMSANAPGNAPAAAPAEVPLTMPSPWPRILAAVTLGLATLFGAAGWLRHRN